MKSKKYAFVPPQVASFQDIVEATSSFYKEVDSSLDENTIHAYAGSYTYCATSFPVGNCTNSQIVGCPSYATGLICPTQPPGS